MGNAPRTISALSMYCPDTVYNQYSGTFNGTTLSFCHTPRATLTSTFADNYSGNTPVTVLSRSALALNWAENQWNRIGFDTPFNYNGIDNLLIEIRWTSANGGLITATQYPDYGHTLMGASAAATGGSLYSERCVLRLETAPSAATPTLAPPDGTYYGTSLVVTISCATTGATVRYTLDGSDPGDGSTAYAEPFAIGASRLTTVKARAFKDGLSPSAVAAGAYTVVPPQGRLRIRANAAPALEGTTRKVVVERVDGSNGVVSTAYVTKPKTALAWADFIPRSGTLTWLDGETAGKPIKIRILADGAAEGNETFLVQLKNPVGAILATPYKATLTIAANSKAPSVADNPTAARMSGLSEALDNPALAWFTSPLSPWTRQPPAAADGRDAAMSGRPAPGLASWLQADLEGRGTLGFDWRLTGAGKESCLLVVDGQVRRLLQAGPGWSRESLSLGAGDHAVRWVFTADPALPCGAAFLDRVTWTPNPD